MEDFGWSGIRLHARSEGALSECNLGASFEEMRENRCGPHKAQRRANSARSLPTRSEAKESRQEIEDMPIRRLARRLPDTFDRCLFRARETVPPVVA